MPAPIEATSPPRAPAATDRHVDRARVLIADREEPIRIGIRTALERDGLGVCAECGDAAAAVAAARRRQADVCLLDVDLPGGGIASAAEIRSIHPDVRIIMLTAHADPLELFAALDAGAVGYLAKDVDVDRLAHIVGRVLAGESAVPRRLLTDVIEELRGRSGGRRLSRPDGRGVAVSDREWEVLELLAQDMTTAGVAARLLLSPVTVRRHVSRMLQRLGVDDRDAAISIFRQATG